MKNLTDSIYCRYGNVSQPDDFMSPFFCRSVGQQKTHSYRSRFIAHDFYELLWTIEGNGALELRNGEKHLLPAGCIFIIPPDQERVIHTGDSDGGAWHYRWITTVGALFGSIAEGFGLKYMVPIPCESLEYYFSQLESILRRYSPKAAREADVVVYSLLNHAARGVEFKQDNVIVRKTVALIDENLSEKILNVDWLAEQLVVNRSHLSRTFRMEMGESPSGYLMRRRIQLAMEYLQRENVKIAEVAANCGFTDSDYFSRFFKKHVGIPPGEYCKQEHI